MDFVSTTSNQLSDHLTTPVAVTVVIVPADSTIPQDSTTPDDGSITAASTSNKLTAPPTQATITSTARTATSTIRLTSATWAPTQPTVTIATSTTQPAQFTALTISTTSTEAAMTTNSTASTGSSHSRPNSTLPAFTAPTSAFSSRRPYPALPSQITAKTNRNDGATPLPPSSTIQILIRGKACTRRHRVIQIRF